MRRWMFLFAFLLPGLLLLGCSAPAEEPALIETDPDAAGGAPALATVTPAATPLTTSEPAATDTPAVVQGEVAPAGEVDLTQLTPTPPDANQTPQVMPAPRVPGAAGTVDNMQQLLDQLIRDLSEREGIPAEDIAVTVVQSVTWPDGSLGCPQEGMMYTMALVDGYQIVLEARNRSYYYHTAGVDYFTFCPDGQPVKSSTP